MLVTGRVGEEAAMLVTAMGVVEEAAVLMTGPTGRVGKEVAVLVTDRLEEEAARHGSGGRRGYKCL